MVATKQPVIPDTIASKIREFLVQAKTGNIILHVSQGKVSSWEIAEKGRIDKSDN